MESNAVVMPSRTLLLTGVPIQMNNSDKIRDFFSKYGALLWVNERYESDPEIAVITFFSISDAIAAFMSIEPVLNVSSIKKSWFEYTKTCELCSYKYSCEESIEHHMAKYHPTNENLNSECDQNATGENFEFTKKHTNNNGVSCQERNPEGVRRGK